MTIPSGTWECISLFRSLGLLTVRAPAMAAYLSDFVNVVKNTSGYFQTNNQTMQQALIRAQLSNTNVMFVLSVMSHTDTVMSTCTVILTARPPARSNDTVRPVSWVLDDVIHLRKHHWTAELAFEVSAEIHFPSTASFRKMTMAAARLLVTPPIVKAMTLRPTSGPCHFVFHSSLHSWRPERTVLTPSCNRPVLHSEGLSSPSESASSASRYWSRTIQHLRRCIPRKRPAVAGVERSTSLGLKNWRSKLRCDTISWNHALA